MSFYLENNNYNVGIYLRISKEEHTFSKVSESILNQKKIIESYIEKNNYNLYKVYSDDGYSGTNFDRPAFKKLLEDIEKHKVDMVITKDLSRLGRDYIQTGYYLEKYFPENNVRYVSILDNIDTGIDSSINDITPFKSIMNDMYAKDISKKIKSVKQQKIKNGEFIGSKAPYGYRRSLTEKNKIEIDNYSSEIVKEIFNMALQGLSARAIAIKLSEKEILPPSLYNNVNFRKYTAYTKHWKAEVVNNILTNEVYLGHMIQGKLKKISYKSKKYVKIPKENWVIVKNTHKPIIDQDIFNKVQEIIAKRKSIKTKTLDYPLKGMILCKDCNIVMGAVPKKEKYYLRCRTYAKFPKLRKCTSHSIRLDKVEQYVKCSIKDIISLYFTKDELISIAIDELKIYYKQCHLNNNIEIINKQLSNIDKEIDIVYLDRVNNILKEEDFIRIYNQKNLEKENLKKELISLNYLEKDKNENDIISKSIEIVENFINVNKFEKIILSQIVDKVEIGDKKDIYIYFKL